MKDRDYHVHSCYCDGKDAPEEIVRKAIALGLREIGIVTHAYTFFDESYCIPKENIGAFQAEMAYLREKYRDRIAVFCGVEQDIYSQEPTDGFDYVIGSVHYLKSGEVYLPVDESRALLEKAVAEHYGGDYYAMAEAYYASVAQLAVRTKPDIIGHFNLICKFNEGEALFSETEERYVRSWRQALDTLLPYGVPFEINTGAMSRGYRSVPYPDEHMIAYIKANGGKLLLSSDSHDKKTLGFAFDTNFK